MIKRYFLKILTSIFAIAFFLLISISPAQASFSGDIQNTGTLLSGLYGPLLGSVSEIAVSGIDLYTPLFARFGAFVQISVASFYEGVHVVAIDVPQQMFSGAFHGTQTMTASAWSPFESAVLSVWCAVSPNDIGCNPGLYVAYVAGSNTTHIPTPTYPSPITYTNGGVVERIIERYNTVTNPSVTTQVAGISINDVINLIKQYAPLVVPPSSIGYIQGSSNSGGGGGTTVAFDGTLASPIINSSTATSTFAGAISATSFVGDGSGLTGITATVAPAGNNGDVQFNDNGSTGASDNLFWDNTNGRLGIGTTNPDFQLSISGSGPVLTHVTTTGGAGSQAVTVYDTPSGQSIFGQIGENGAVLTTGIAGEFIFNNRAGPIVFSADSAYNRKDVYISTAGNVGIGATDPTAKLDVLGAANTTVASIGAELLNGHDYFDLNFFSGSGGAFDGQIRYIAEPLDPGGRSFALMPGGAEAARFQSNGNVGIGNTAPAYKLDVGGDINFTGNLYQNGSLFSGSQWTTSGDNIYNNNISNVGIGTTAPNDKLDVNGNITLRGGLSYISPTNNPSGATASQSNDGVNTLTANDSTYTYRIYGVNDGVYSQNYAETSVTDDNSGHTFHIPVSWTGGGNATSYRILRDVNGGGFNESYDTSSTSFVDGDNSMSWSGDVTVTPNITPYISSQVASISTGGDPRSVAISGNYAYVANIGDNSLSIFDVTDPTNPSLVATPSTGSGPVSVFVSGDYAYVSNYNDGTLSIFDVSTPSSPSLVATPSTGSGPVSVFVSGNYAYVANSSDNTISVFDITDPSLPSLVATSSTGNTPWSVAISGNYAYVANSSDNTISVFDITDPSSPSLVATSSTGNSPWSVAISGNYAYVANYDNNSLSIFDVSTPASPSLVATSSTGNSPRSVAISGNYAYVANSSDNTISVFDITDPSLPSLVATSSTGNSPWSVAISGNYAYVANQSSATLSILAPTVTDPSSPASSQQGASEFTANNSTYTYRVYAYNGSYYSQNYSEYSVTDDNSSNTFNIPVSWNPTSGATSYRILRDINGGGFNEYYDTSSTGFTDGNNTVTWTPGNNVLPNQASNGTSSIVSAYGRFQVNTGAESDPYTALTVTSDGKVGIGTISPEATLDVRSAVKGLQVINSGLGTGETLYLQNSNSGYQADFTMENDRGGYSSYGGFLYGGSSEAFSLFGSDRADRLFIYADGPNNLGLTIGTLQAQPVTFGTNNMERVRIDSAGNVGIGTSNPLSTLQISDAGGNPAVGIFTATTDPTARTFLGFYNENSDLSTYSVVGRENSAGGSIFAGTDPYATVLGTWNTAAPIQFVAGRTSPDGGLVAMTIQANTGNVGIGTTNPTQKLTVAGNILIDYAGTTNYLYADGSNAGVTINNGAGAYYSFGTLNDAFVIQDENASASRLLVSSAGNVGIGTTAPNDKLDVNGNFTLRGTPQITYPTNDPSGATASQSNDGVNQFTADNSTYTYRIYGVRDGVYSQNYAETSLTDDNSGHTFHIPVSWTGAGNATSFRILRDVNSAGFNESYDTSSTSFTDGDNSMSWGGDVTVTPTTLPYASNVVATISTGSGPGSVYVTGGYAYVANQGGDTFSVFDVTNPESPSLVSTTATGDNPTGIFVSGSYAYVVNYNDSTMSIFDVTDPTSPVLVATPSTGTNPFGVFVSGSYAYTANPSDATVSIFDVTDPTSPVPVATPSSTGAQSLFVIGDYLYVTNGSGLNIFDVTDPTSPSFLAASPANGSASNVISVSGGYAYVSNYSSGDVSIFDVSTPATPTLVATQATGNNPTTLFVSGNYLYVGNYGDSNITIYDISTPASPVLVASPTASGPNGTFITGGYLYVTDYGGSNLSIFAPTVTNLSSPSSSQQSVSEFTANNSTYTYRVYAYNGTYYSQNYSEYSVTDDNSSNTFNIPVSWDATAGATSYRILRDVNGGGFNEYYDTSSTSFTDGNSTMSWTSGNTVTPNSASSQLATLSSYGKFQINTNADDSPLTALTVTTDGNVGIGTTTPGYPLEIYSTISNAKINLDGGGTSGQNGIGFGAAGGGDYFYAYSYADGFGIYDNTTTNQPFTILNNGNVGIGTTNPQATLDVAGTLKVGEGGFFISTGVGDAEYTQGAIFDSGWIAKDTGSAKIAGYLGDLYLSADTGLTVDNPFNPTTRMFISGTTGNVGIGTANPTANLTIAKNGGAPSPNTDGNAVLVLDSAANSTNMWFNVPNAGEGGTNATLGFTVDGAYKHGITYNVANNYLALTNDGANANPTTGLFVDGSGNVGIGTTTPGATLTVQGGMSGVNGIDPLTVVGSNGTDSDSMDSGGSAGNISLITGSGGSNTIAAGGNAGNFVVITGNGGDASNDGNGGAGGNITFTAGRGGAGGQYNSEIPGDGGSITFQAGAAGTPGVQTASDGNILLNPSGVGKVGIGTTTPGFVLDVGGDINFIGGLYQNGELFAAGSSQWTTLGDDIYNNNIGNVGIGTTTPTSTLTVEGSIFALGINGAGTDGLVDGTGFTFQAGTGNGDLMGGSGGTGAFFTINGGTGSASAIGGDVVLTAGNGGMVNGENPASGGTVTITGGAAAAPGCCGGSPSGGSVHITGGSSANGPGGDVTLTAGQMDGSYSMPSIVLNGNTLGISIQAGQNDIGGYLNTSINANGGNVSIGTSTVELALHVATTDTGAVARFTNGNGAYCDIDPDIGAIGINCTSDARLKKDIVTMSASSSMENLLKLQAVTFRWNSQTDQTLRYGFIAQQVEPIFPDLVLTDANGIKSVAYGSFIPVIVSALQELDGRVAHLESLIASSTPLAQASGSSWIGDLIRAAVGRFGKVQVEDGIEIRDKATGKIYCTTIVNGEWSKTEGECSNTPMSSLGDTTSSTPAPTPAPVSTPTATSTPDTTTSTTTDTTATTTTPIDTTPTSTPVDTTPVPPAPVVETPTPIVETPAPTTDTTTPAPAPIVDTTPVQ